jgi:glycosyltransferase involved in cell wall biosynthesis
MIAEAKIALVCDKFPVPSETFVQRHAEVLDAEIFTLELTALLRDARWADRVQVLGIAPGHKRTRVLAEKIYRRAARTPWRIWLHGDCRRLQDALAEHRITAVLVEFGQCFIGCGAAVLAAGVNVVPHFHGVDLSAHLRDPRYVRKLRPLLQRCRDVIVVNDVMSKRLRKVFDYTGRIHCVPCAPNADLFANVRRETHEGLNFLFVGRLVEKKGVLELVRAFAQYARLGGPGTLTLAGEGPCRKAVAASIQSENLAGRVDLIGAVTHEQAAGLMARADVYVQHSKVTADGDEEGWPVAIAEACLVGLPVVATVHAGIPTQVVSGQTGFLVKENDVDGMARAMLALANSATLREQFGRAARQHIQPFCNPITYRNRLREILASSQPASATV